MTSAKLIVSTLAIMAASAGASAARDRIQIAGSSTVLPYATIVAQAFKDNFGHSAIVEGGGSGAGIKQFCEGLDDNGIDIANASRPMKAAELETCKANGVTEVMEVRIGYDGIVFASAIDGPDFVLEPADVFSALAREVIVDGNAVANPHTRWAQVNPALPDQPILVFIPGTKHGTREVFEEKLMQAGCEASGASAVLTDAGQCSAIRTDGLSVDIDGDYTETLSRLDSNREAVGVFGLSFYENNTDKLKVAPISGVMPATETIASGEYPVSRPLFFYVKKQNMASVPALKDFVEFFVSEDMAGPGGPLADYGLVSDPDLAATRAAVADQAVMQ